LFSKSELKLFGDGYFAIIRVEEKYVEVMSLNTKHCWIVFKKELESEKPIILYHKHTKDTEYYHNHWQTGTVKNAVNSIKNHDDYVVRQSSGGKKCYGKDRKKNESLCPVGI